MTEPPPRQAVDTLISGALIVTMDAEHRVIGDGAVAILGDRIGRATASMPRLRSLPSP
jgi:hypothetical protein